MDSDFRDDEPKPYPDEDNGDDCDFADGPGDPHVEVCGCLRQD